jgi:hypothetical protein
VKRKPKQTAKSVSMMGKSNEPFARKAKKAENDDKPHVKPGAPSVNKNMARGKQAARVKRLTGMML